MSADHLYSVINKNNPEMDENTFGKVILHMDKEISDYEISVLFKVFDEDQSGMISR